MVSHLVEQTINTLHSFYTTFNKRNCKLGISFSRTADKHAARFTLRLISVTVSLVSQSVEQTINTLHSFYTTFNKRNCKLGISFSRTADKHAAQFTLRLMSVTVSLLCDSVEQTINTLHSLHYV